MQNVDRGKEDTLLVGEQRETADLPTETVQASVH